MTWGSFAPQVEVRSGDDTDQRGDSMSPVKIAPTIGNVRESFSFRGGPHRRGRVRRPARNNGSGRRQSRRLRLAAGPSSVSAPADLHLASLQSAFAMSHVGSLREDAEIEAEQEAPKARAAAPRAPVAPRASTQAPLPPVIPAPPQVARSPRRPRASLRRSSASCRHCLHRANWRSAWRRSGFAYVARALALVSSAKVATVEAMNASTTRIKVRFLSASRWRPRKGF